MRTCSLKRAPHANREHAATTCTRAREAIMRPAMSMAIAIAVFQWLYAQRPCAAPAACSRMACHVANFTLPAQGLAPQI